MSKQIYKTIFQIRRGSTAEWESVNPILREGEPGWDITVKKQKIGDGISAWKDLPYATAELQTEFDEHLADGTQHKKTARFVVGTSTAGWTSADCDYLCDGTADQMEINNAITALPATGGEIVILDGTYNITAKIDVTKDNVSIKGNGNATTLKRMFNSSVKEGIITLTNRRGCKIANLQIEGDKISYSNSNNCGISLVSSHNNTITGNTCNVNKENGIYLYTSNSNTVTGNTCNKNNSGIYLEYANSNTVTGNNCNDNTYGIYLYSSNSNTVTGNNCNSNNCGISLVSSHHNTITGNACINNIWGTTYNSGIYLEYANSNTVTGNTCSGNKENGIFLDTCYNNTITGNTCNNNNSGIYLDQSINATVTGNVCNDNTYGIFLGQSDNSTVVGNTCICGTGLATDYTESQHTIRLEGKDNNNNLVAMNNCMGKAVTSESGTGNTLVYNKFDAS